MVNVISVIEAKERLIKRTKFWLYACYGMCVGMALVAVLFYRSEMADAGRMLFRSRSLGYELNTIWMFLSPFFFGVIAAGLIRMRLRHLINQRDLMLLAQALDEREPEKKIRHDFKAKAVDRMVEGNEEYVREVIDGTRDIQPGRARHRPEHPLIHKRYKRKPDPPQSGPNP